MSRKSSVPLCMVGALFFASVAHSQIVVPVLDGTSTNLNPFSTGTPPKLTDNSGLSAAINNGATLAAAQGATHVFDGGFNESWVTNASTGDYFATGVGGASKPTFVWDLGSAQAVNNLVLWQYQNNGGNTTNVGNHTRTFDLRFSPTTTFSGPAFSGTITPVIGAATNDAQTINLSSTPGSQNARYVELTVTDNAVGYTGVTGGGDRVGLGEIRFDTSAAPTAFTRELITPTSITQTAGNTLGGFSANNLINDSGLNGAADIDNYTSVQHTTQNGSTLWVTSTASFPNYYNGVNPNPQFELDLGDTYDLTDLVVWGYSNTNSNGASDFLVEFSDDGGISFYDGVEVATGRFLGQDNATLVLGDTFEADFVRLTMLDNVAGRGLTTLPGGDRAGLGEIKFIASQQVVPEPASIAIWSLIGLALTGYGWRRWRRD